MKIRTMLRLFALCMSICLCLSPLAACDTQTEGETQAKTPSDTVAATEPRPETEAQTEADTDAAQAESEQSNSSERESESESKSENKNENERETGSPNPDANGTAELKLGVILIHGENSLYDLNFIEAVERAKTELGLSDEQVIYKKNVPEGLECYEVAVELVEAGCNVIFANSFGHEAHLLRAAREYPDVEFCHAGGYQARVNQLDNFHNAFAAVYTGKFLSGVAAGLKLTEMIENGTITASEAKMGYIVAFPYAECVSAYTAFYLGAKYVCPDVTMEVVYANSWYDPSTEEVSAHVLIERDCVLIAQGSESLSAAAVCAQAGVPFIASYENAVTAYPDTVIMSDSINWTPYFLYICNQVRAGEAIATDWTGTLATGSIALSEVNAAAAAEGTQQVLEEIKAKLIAGEIHVFDIDTFTVNHEPMTSYRADVDYDEAFMSDTEVIFDGYFHESEMRSAPYFDIYIDGITYWN